MQKKYILTLTDAERKQLREIIRTGKSSARRVMRAPILLHADDEAARTCVWHGQNLSA